MKKGLIVFLVISLVLIAGLFLFRSCEITTKDDQTGSEERTGFINANIDFTCYLLQNPEAFDDPNTFDQVIYEKYQKYGLPVDDDISMISILDRYENITEIQELITINSAPCKTGEEPVFIEG